MTAEAGSNSKKGVFRQTLFTCRPDVQLDEARATRISLSGLSAGEVEVLIAACGVKIEDRELALELHEATDGHPLWVRLIAMQAIRGDRGLRGALDHIREGGATLPDTTRVIWDKLNEQQRDVLRTMAELDRPETEGRLLDLLPGINANRVNRALRTLRWFHLIETRTQAGGGLLLGLHPIIREFVRTSFPKKDRERYVEVILESFDRLISRFKNLLEQDPSYDILEHWFRKADIQIDFGHFEEATNTIFEIAQPAVNRGYTEALIRIGLRLFDGMNWAEACSSYRHFDGLFEKCLRCLIEFGREESDGLLERYEKGIPGKSAQYILLCDLRCYAEWHIGNYRSAIRWGEDGERLKQATSVDTGFSTRHNLALARRDSGQFSEALESFLAGESLASVVMPSERIDGKAAPFYGNIGRCLFLMCRLGQARVCYVKSAQLIEESRSESSRLNKGFIRYWIGELLLLQEDFGTASALLRAAECTWNRCAPQRADRAKQKLEEIVAVRPQFREYVDMEEWEVEEEYRLWLDRQWT